MSFEKAWDKFAERCRKEGVARTGLTVQEVVSAVFPFRPKGAKEISKLTPALLFRVKNTIEDTLHTVVVSYVSKEIMIWCADGLFISGSSPRYKGLWDEYLSLCKKKGIDDILPSYTDNVCNYWRNGKDCKHTRFVQSLISADPDSYRIKMEELIQKYSFFTQDDDISDEFSSLKSLAFRCHVLIEGEQGSGKTYTAFKVAQEMLRAGEVQDIVVGQGDSSVEATDLLGYWIKDASGNLVWKDGVLTEAFRKAQKGKVVLLFDEFYRLRDREKDIFVRALTVFPDGKLRLRTGRVTEIDDGIAKEEVLEVPKENLWVIATTNVGSQFLVDEADPALAERFIPIRRDTERSELNRILLQVCKKHKIEDPHDVAKCLVSFYVKTKNMVKEGMLSGFATTRTLVRAIEIAPTPDKQGVKEGVWMQRYLWIGRDSMGYPVQEQEEYLRQALEQSFGG